jgi:hypothetical protein
MTAFALLILWNARRTKIIAQNAGQTDLGRSGPGRVSPSLVILGFRLDSEQL